MNDNLPKLVLDKKRFRVKECPCGKSNKDGKFVPYVGYDNKGYCHSCGETFLPELKNSIKSYQNLPPLKKQVPIAFIPHLLFEKQFQAGKHLNARNTFIKWLGDSARGCFAFDTVTIEGIIEKYRLLNSGKLKYQGWALFPYIDINGRVRDIKAMAYDPTTGKRIKEPYKVLFIGKEVLNDSHANTVRCFYGEHLLKGNSLPVKIFESEATATYASAFYPGYVCLATGGNNGCKWTEKAKCDVIKGRKIMLYPDLDAHEDWVQKAKILSGHGLDVMVSQLIQKSAELFAKRNSISYEALVNQKFDLRDVLKYKNLYDFVPR